MRVKSGKYDSPNKSALLAQNPHVDSIVELAVVAAEAQFGYSMYTHRSVTDVLWSSFFAQTAFVAVLAAVLVSRRRFCFSAEAALL